MKRVVVIGLGIFGFNIAKDLFENGLEVIAIDKNKEIIQKIKDFSTKAILADGTDKEVIESIGIQEDDVVIISFGEDLAASTLITLHLKEMKVKTIIVKAPNEDHKHVSVGFVGSIAANFRGILYSVAKENGVTINKIISSPIDELVKYHLPQP